MFWALILVLMAADGTKSIQAKVEPTQQSCAADALKVLREISTDKPEELLAAAVRCDGPFQDPTVPKQKV
jgi:hypothetical protein